MTMGGMKTDVKGTFVPVILAVLTLKSRWTETGVGTYPILAGTPILARIWQAVIDVHLTVVP